jgi:hypothetical protein
MKKQILILMGIATLTYASASLTFIETSAALTPPTSYDYSFQWKSTDNVFFYNDLNNNTSSLPLFDRTTDSTYFNYSHTYSNVNSHSNPDTFSFPQGFNITMTFNRSNTTWGYSSTFDKYYVLDSKIGSNNTVGGIKKMFLQFSNNTNKDYQLYFDHSTTNQGTIAFGYSINSIWLGRIQTNDGQLLVGTMMASLYIPAYSNVVLERITNASFYFDAWYLKDLGLNGAYDAGYDNGFTNGISATPMTTLFTIAFGAIGNIFNIEVLGNLTFGNIMFAPIAIALLWFILGIISGVGGKPQGKK